MYADKTNGVDVSPLLLNAYLTVAKPMMSNNDYRLFVTIWDKKGQGTYQAEFKFDVKANEHISIEKSEGLSYDNIYLFSEQQGTIVNNEISIGETYYLLMEGVDGFVVNEGKISVGLSMKASDADGNEIYNEVDMLGDGPFDVDLVKEQVSAKFILRDQTIKSPVALEVMVYDKNSDKKISSKISLEF